MSSLRGGFIAPIVVRSAAVIIASLPLAATAEEFMAYPGLWKTVQTVAAPATTAAEPQTNWHCVDEAEDPWSAYAQITMPEDNSCTQTQSERTGTSLEWTVECKGTTAITSRGKIIFDSPSHYRGEVQLSGSFMGYLVNDKIALEGQRYAACTSPSD